MCTIFSSFLIKICCPQLWNSRSHNCQWCRWENDIDMDKYYMSSCYEYPPKKKLHFKDRVEDTFFFWDAGNIDHVCAKSRKSLCWFQKGPDFTFFLLPSTRERKLPQSSCLLRYLSKHLWACPTSPLKSVSFKLSEALLTPVASFFVSGNLLHFTLLLTTNQNCSIGLSSGE